MAISQIAPTKPDADYSLAAVSTWANTNAFGRDRCSLTEWDTTTVPELAEGSIFETGGAYYQVDSDTAITVGAVSDGFVFILVNTTVPAVPTLQFTNSVPVWDASKFGYYDTGTNYKVLAFKMQKSGSTYADKQPYDPNSRLGISSGIDLSGVWSVQRSAADNQWREVAYGAGVFVAVSDTGTGNRVMTSPDGVTWTSRTSAADLSWRGATYGNGVFVAVAVGDSGSDVMTSPDGITWTSRSTVTGNWSSVIYGNSGFVAVSGTGEVMTSPNGVTWTSRTSAAANQWESVCWSETESVFVAVSSSGTGNRVMTSPNGVTWTSRTSAADNDWYSVVYGNGLFVATAITGTDNRVMTSPDGITWTLRTSADDLNWYSVSYGNGLFVAVSSSVMTSPDGISWTLRSNSPELSCTAVAYAVGKFVAVAVTGTNNRVMTSNYGVI